jgi:hypothetical protein
MSSNIKHIRGDWMINGYIDNLNRERRLAVEVIEGVAYDPHEYSDGRPLKIEDGEIWGWGASVSFLPDERELARVGIAQ